MSPRPANPFRYGKPVHPDDLVGRAGALALICDRLYNAESTAVVGQPHIGKSSVLRYLRDSERLDAHLGRADVRFLAISLDCHQLAGSYQPADFWAFVLDRIEGTVELQAVHRQIEVVRRSAFGSLTLGRLFDLLAAEGWCVVLLIDEFDTLLYHPNFNTAEFFGALRSLTVNTESLALVTASRLTIAEMNRRSAEINPLGSPFFNTLIEVRLMPLTDAEVETLLDRALANTGVSFSDEDRAYLQQAAGGYPFLVQMIGAALFDAYLRGLGSDSLRQIDDSLRVMAEAYLDDIWRHLDDELRAPLRALAWAEIRGEAVDLDSAVDQLRRLANDCLIITREGDQGAHCLRWEGQSWGLRAGIFARWLAEQPTALAKPRAVLVPQAILRRRIADHFSIEELNTLAFDLGLASDQIEGSTRDARTQALIVACERRGLMEELIALCREQRPNLAW